MFIFTIFKYNNKKRKKTALTVVLYYFLNSNTSKNNAKELTIIISYRPLWETMKKKEISQYALLKAGIDNRTLNNLKKGKNITLLTLEKLCNIIDCTPNDIIEFI